MKIKPLALCSPILLCFAAGAARADLEPFSFGASETIRHETNILHSDTDAKADWLSTTEFRAALDQAIGRERLLGTASVNVDRYASERGRNSEGYALTGEFDWSTIGDLSGAIGGDSRRHQYLYGLEGDRASGVRNLETDNHAFARVQLGGMGRWSIFSGFDASERKYSEQTFDVDEQQQWVVSGGTSYATSPDLSFGLQGRYVRGRYPYVVLDSGVERFSSRTVGVNTKWVASGNSAFDANVGYTTQHIDGQDDQHFINGGLNWRWTPPSRFSVTLGARRDSANDVGAAANIVNANNSINGRSLNTSGHLDVGYELTAKVNLGATAQFVHRKYSNANIPTGLVFGGEPVFTTADGASNTMRFALSANYAPTRTTTLGCSVAHERMRVDESIAEITPRYTDNTVMCTGAITFK